MDFDLSEDQAMLQDAVASIAARFQGQPNHAPAFHHYDPELDAALSDGGFFEISRQDGFGALDAALTLEAIAKLPRCVELGASLLVAPNLVDEVLPRPIALLSRPDVEVARFLSVARTAIIDAGDDVLILDLEATAREPAEGVFAYPYGRFTSPPNLQNARRLGQAAVPKLRQWWRASIAVELAAAMQAGLDFTVEYVKERRQFNKSIGSFQAVQHRLAADASTIQGLRWLALAAVWNGKPDDAALAATFAQDVAHTVGYDLHQFNGALGVTLEHALHFWTWRLRALQGELGGTHYQAAASADLLWNSDR